MTPCPGYHTFHLMKANATILYRSPSRVFAAADKGETVTIERLGVEYILQRKPSPHQLYGATRGSIKKDLGRPTVQWKAMR